MIIKAGSILVLVCQDYDDRLVPLAFAHTESESEDDWVFLFELLIEALPGFEPLLCTMGASFDDEMMDICIKFVSDMGKGLAAALRRLFRWAPVSLCIEHRKVLIYQIACSYGYRFIDCAFCMLTEKHRQHDGDVGIQSR